MKHLVTFSVVICQLQPEMTCAKEFSMQYSGKLSPVKFTKKGAGMVIFSIAWDTHMPYQGAWV